MNILVLRALGLGDLLTAVPALRALRRAYPGATITLAAPAWLSDAVSRIQAVDHLLPTEGLVPIDWPGSPPDLAVNLHGIGPQSTQLLAKVCPARLIAHQQWNPDRHEVDRWCDLLARNGIPADASDLHLGATGHRGPAVVHPGASHGSRRWPGERYAEVVRALGPDVVVTGDASEKELVKRVAGSVPTRIGGSVGGLLDLIAAARLVVCGDTGVAHVATAYRTPSVVLFGPVSPGHWGPRTGPHRALWHGRTGDTFADRPDPGLLAITVDEVLTAVADLQGGELWQHNASQSSARATSG
ncbi:glycosyltransferase family 9 protein [Kibdelosporangium philippinense]|uniref:Glycosyltransferase family 9 protein n=1 Tax=Kibdelosporangium philippinense TaxID=211113 RepID=A0ABS8Z731_9PSEU|nr:glycosyltransferase family 9 protein [Kibdelosporangium philippinense]MCE7003690.1 glycosyltransferase family 9 protein [Kibdelosporangium philippinense]